MARSTRLISLNLGSQTIGLAEFRVEAHGGLALVDYRFREIPVDPTGERMGRAQMLIALGEMMNELQIKRGRVNYAVSGQSVFARFVKLPSVGEEKIEKIISFEAQQNVPFPIDEVVWDYQLVGGGGNEPIQVILVAIKVDLLDEVNNAVEQTGLRASVVDAAPMALYNAFRYSYSDLSGCSLLVDIGARTTNLLFIEPARVFSRSIPIGGSSITAAIAREFGEPFAAAESRKKRDGFVSLGGVYAEPTDPDVARVSKCKQLSNGVEPASAKCSSEAGIREAPAVLHDGGGLLHSRFAWLVSLLHAGGPSDAAEHAGSSTKDRHHEGRRNAAR